MSNSLGSELHRDTSSRSRMIALIAAGVVALLTAGGVFWAVNSSTDNPVLTEPATGPTTASAERAEPATAEPAIVFLTAAHSRGEDPFTESIVRVPPTELTPAIIDIIAARTEALTPDAVSGALTARGDEPGIYGASNGIATCDLSALSAILAADNSKAEVWAGALGIKAADLAAYVPSLTPLILLNDVAVTGFAYRDSKAVPSQYILQTGTAVLVDLRGQPAVRCASGNPLAQPESIDLGTAQFEGDEWTGFAARRTVAVSPAAVELPKITAVDLITGELYDQATGTLTSSPGLLVAVGEQTSTSLDGVIWTAAAQAPNASRIAYGDGLLVAAGSPADTSQASTLVYTSTDGVSWSEQQTLSGRVADIAYADGLWVIVTTNSGTAGSGSLASGIDGALQTSQDGITWTEQELTANSGDWDVTLAANSLSISGGVWLLEALGYQGDSEAQVVQRSTDQGRTWQLVPFTNPVTGSSLAPLGLQWGWDGTTLAALGTQLDEVRLDGPSVYSAQGGVSSDGGKWSFLPTSPPDAFFSSLTYDAGRGWIAAGRVGDFETGIHSVYGSSDLYSWTLLGTPDGAVSDVAIIPGELPEGYQPPTAPPASQVDPASDGPCLATTDSGNQLELRAVSGAIPSCAKMTQVWTAANRGEGEFTGPRSIELEIGWSCAYAPITETGASGIAGSCTPDDGSNPGFQLVAAGSGASAPTAAGPSSNLASTVEGDLNLSIPMTRPACDGTGIVVLGSAVTPSAYVADVQNLLKAHPGSSYLRTDRACLSLNQATSNGDAIYAVFQGSGSDEETLRAAVCAAGGDAYGKWLDNTTDPSLQVKC